MNDLYSEKDRRRYARVQSYWLVRYYRTGSQEHPPEKTANLHNVSEGGLLFTAYEFLPVSTLIRILIRVPQRDEPINACAKVVHCTRTVKGADVYHVGVSFLDISETDRREIAAYVEKLAGDKDGRRLVLKFSWWQTWRSRKLKWFSRRDSGPSES